MTLPIAHQILAGLTLLGRLGTWAVAASLFAGLALPQFAVMARPLVPAVAFGLLTIAFTRMPVEEISKVLKNPLALFSGIGAIQVAIPCLAGIVLIVFGMPELAPETGFAIFLMVIAPPVVSSPAFAELLGLDSVFSLAILVGAMIVTPILAPIAVSLYPDSGFVLEGWSLGLRLGLLIGGAGLAAMVIRRLIGIDTITGRGQMLDGINVLLLFVFIVALMGDTAYVLIDEPLFVLGMIGLTFLVAGTIASVTFISLIRLGPVRALTVSMAASNRNLGLIAAVAGGNLSKDVWLWFALAQFPIYLLPLIVKPIARRVVLMEAAGRQYSGTGSGKAD